MIAQDFTTGIALGCAIGAIASLIIIVIHTKYFEK